MRVFLLLQAVHLAALLGFGRVQARDWTELEGVIFEENAANDADSFHAKRNRSRYLFRLYFLDAPETDLRYPDRVEEQAAYFGVTPETAVKEAKNAAAFLQELLNGQSFTVYTRYADAQGASDMKRYYAMVKVGDRWLSELLVEKGYARIHGVGTELPDGTSERIFWSRLRKLEREAKAEKRGLWGEGKEAKAAPLLLAGQKIRLPALTAVFQIHPPHQPVGTLPAGWEVTLGPEKIPGFREVQFVSPGGNAFTGMVQESTLP
ncbi:MAG: thermonuclease family protein [Kiritimatiellia bacterium]